MQEVDKGKAKLHDSSKRRRMASSMPTQSSGLLRSPPGNLTTLCSDAKCTRHELIQLSSDDFS